MTVKDRLHRMVDGLPEDEAHLALRFVQFLCDSENADVPNEETVQTFRDTDAGGGLTTHASVTDMFRHLGI